MEDGAIFFMGAGASGVFIISAEALVLFLAGLDAVLLGGASSGLAVSVAGGPHHREWQYFSEEVPSYWCLPLRILHPWK